MAGERACIHNDLQTFRHVQRQHSTRANLSSCNTGSDGMMANIVGFQIKACRAMTRKARLPATSAHV